MLIAFILICNGVALLHCATATDWNLAGNEEVYAGATLMKYFTIDQPDVVIISCYVTYRGANSNTQTVLLNVGSNYAKLGQTEDDDEEPDAFRSRIVPLRRGVCGFTVSDYTPNDPLSFTLMVEYQLGYVKRQDETFTLIYTDIKGNNRTVQNVVIGNEIDINDIKGTSCIVITPENEYVDDVNYYTIKAVQPRHIGVWKFTCLNSTFPIEYEIELRAIDNMDVLTWYDTTDSGGYGRIGCQIVNTDAEAPLYCILTRPDGEQVFISDAGAATERYTSIGLDLANYRCEIEFKLPLEKSEIGLWECRISTTGRFINTEPSPAVAQKVRQIFADVFEVKQIGCTVPYSSDACSIMDPQGNTRPGGGLYTDFYLGRCQVTIHVTQEDFGVWKCMFSQPHTSVDEVINIELVNRFALQASFVEVEVIEDDSLELICSSKLELRSCYFIAPNGSSFHTALHKVATNDDDFRYIGRGLTYGDCGIRFREAKMEYNGLWTCNGKLAIAGGNFVQAANTTVYVIKQGITSTSTAIIAPITVMSVALLALIFAGVYKMRKRTIYHQPIVESNEPEEIEMETVELQ